MVRRLRSRWAITGGVVVVLLSTACMQLAPVVAPPWAGPNIEAAPAGDAVLLPVATGGAGLQVEATAAPSTALSSMRQTVAVRRGTISELLSLPGRVAALEEIAITYPGIGRVEAVAVKAGDAVEEGQLLLQVETREIEREMSAARARLEMGTIRLEQARAQAQARQRQNEQRAEAERIRRHSQVVDAEAGVRRAQEDLARVQGGAPASERRMAEAGVVSARSGVERAEAELVRASAGPSQAELRAADQQVWAARLALHRAQADFDRLARGADQVELRAAEREVAAAQSALDRARMDLERLVRGDPAAITAAERDVQRAQLGLRTAQAMRVDLRGSRDEQRSARAARDASISSAILALRDAEDRLNTLRRGPPPGEIEVARRGVQQADSALRTAMERLELVRRGPDALALATANQAVESARIAEQQAEARYLELEAGPPVDRVASAQDALRSARASLASAQDRVAELNSRPTRAELRDAEERVSAAHLALERAKSEPEPLQEDVDVSAFDLVVLEKNLEQDRGQVEALERSLATTTMVAPFQGVVSSIQVRPGDSIDRGVQVLTLARPGDPIVMADVSSEDMSRVADGQQAIIRFEGANGVHAGATVTGLLDGIGGVGKVAQLRVEWPTSPPMYGSAVQAVVTLQEKSGVLVVPQRAVRSSGQRRYVEVMSGDIRRTVDVSTGVVGATDIEILSGLHEGQLIVAGTVAPSAGSATSTGARVPAATP